MKYKILILINIVSLMQLIGCKKDEVLSSDNQIIEFKFSNLNPSVTGTIDEINRTIKLEVPNGTAITALIPSITVSNKATVNPSSGVSNDFTNPVTYTVTAQNGNKQTYTVTVVSPSKQIISFDFSTLSPVITGTINENNHTISLKVPYNTDVTALKPTININGKEISPASQTAQNFSTPVQYTVTASNGSTQVYTVNVEISPINVASISWRIAGLTNLNVSCLAVSGKNIFAGFSNGVYLSTNNGSTWTELTRGAGISFVNTITISGSNIYIGTKNGIYVSKNNGSTWTPLVTVAPDPSNKGSFYSIAVNGPNIFAPSFGVGVYRSTDSGTQWDLTTNGLTNLGLVSIITSGNNIVASGSGGSYISTNTGVSWSPITLPITSSFASIGGSNYAATINGVYVSSDNGSSWTSQNAGLGTSKISTILASGNNLFVGGNGIVFLSSNGGEWTSISNGLPSEGILGIAISGSTIFVATDIGVYSSWL